MLKELAKKYGSVVHKHTPYFYYVNIMANTRYYITLRAGGQASSIPTGYDHAPSSVFTHVELGFVLDDNYFCPKEFQHLFDGSNKTLQRVPLDEADKIISDFISKYRHQT